MTSIRTSALTKDFGNLGAVDSISLKVGQDTFRSMRVLHIQDMALLARRLLCAGSSSS